MHEDLNQYTDEELFAPVSHSDAESEKIAAPRYSYWKSVFRVFFRKKVNIIALCLLLFVILFAYIYPSVTSYDPYANLLDPNAKHLGPAQALNYFGHELKWILGSGASGESTFDAVWNGSRISISLAFICAAINMFIGVMLGAVWGFSKKVDMVMMRMVDVIYSVPAMIYIILIMLILGSNVYSVMIGICVNGWVNMARIVRSEVITLKEREFAVAAFVMGASKKRILFRHLVVNAMGPIIVTATLMVPQAIFNEAFLSFIGIGISAPAASLGTLAQDAKMLLAKYPMQMVYPVAVICVVIFALNFIGDGLEEALNPKGRR